eukprot:13115822-Ditylum_brightwellii.AAC.1
MGIMVSKSTPIFMGNMGVILNATNHGGTLNRKAVELAYHYVREHAACGVGYTGGSDQGVLPEVKFITLSGTLLIPAPSGNGQNLEEVKGEDICSLSFLQGRQSSAGNQD